MAGEKGPKYKAQLRLEWQAWDASQAGDMAEASRFASQMLAENADLAHWNYGNVIHAANSILGRAALRDGDIEAAKGYLLAAGRTPGSPQLNSFGPPMTLAQELLARGESQVVLDYLDLVATFWAAPEEKRPSSRDLASQNAESIRAWKAAILAGETPTLNDVGMDAPLPKKPRHKRNKPIEDVIASLTLVAVDPSGRTSELRAEVGRPYARGTFDAACPSALWGMTGRYPDMIGGDTMHALGLAMRLPKVMLLGLIEDGWKLYYPGEEQEGNILTADDVNNAFGGG